MKKLLFTIAFITISLSLALYQPNNTSAQTPVQQADNADPAGYSDFNDFTTTILSPTRMTNPNKPDEVLDPNSSESIDNSVEQIKITFPDVEEGRLAVCLEGDLCVSDFNVRNQILNATPEGLSNLPLISNGLKGNIVTADRFEGGKDGKLNGNSITVCGDGTKNLKTDCSDEKKNYFHGGSTYYITLYEKGDDDSWIIRRKAGIYINHRAPIVTVVGINGKSPEKLKLTLSQDYLYLDGKEKNNNFQIVAEGTGGYKQEKCIPKGIGDGKYRPDSKGSNAYTVEFPFKENGQDGNGLVAGKYTIKVNEQVNDNRIIGNGCEGGFTYIKFECTVPPSNKNATTTCESTEDPNGSDTKHLRELLDDLGKEKSSIIPCKEGQANPGLLNCGALDTAIGPIPLNPIGFITKVFQIVLAVAGLGATILILYAGYRLLLSRGDKEVIQAQRERITSAIVGLLFIIFSLVLLSVIAGDVLKIPGFNNNPLPQTINTR